MDKRQLVMLDTIFRSLAEMEERHWIAPLNNITPEEYLVSPSGRMMIENVYDMYKNGVQHD